MISQENTSISTLFSGLRNKGVLVYNFNSSHSLRSGQRRLCDLIIITNQGVHFIEVKLTSTKDKFTSGQETLMEKVENINILSDVVNYWEIDSLETAQAVYSFIEKEI